MANMFYHCANFDQDLSNWDVSNVKNMEQMFYNCINLNGKWLNKWNVTINNKYQLYNMFYKCTYIKTKPQWYRNAK